METYEQFLIRVQARWGDNLDTSDLADQFKPYFRTGVRIKVRTYFGDLTGTVGVTTGWKPIFLLMRRSNDIGSCITLSSGDRIVAVQRGRTYHPLSTED